MQQENEIGVAQYYLSCIDNCICNLRTLSAELATCNYVGMASGVFECQMIRIDEPWLMKSPKG